MQGYKTTLLTYMQCVSSLLDLLSPIDSIESIYLMGSFARGDYEVGQSDIDLTIITRNLDERPLGRMSLKVGKIVSSLRERNSQFERMLSMPKIATFSDWYSTEALDPAEYGLRDQKEAKLLFGKENFFDPIVPLCDLRTDMLDILITHSMIALGEATYTLLEYDSINSEKQTYWFWKSFLNALRYFFWLTGDIYMGKLQDVSAFAAGIFGENFPFLQGISKKDKLNLEILADAYNFLTAICLKSISLHACFGSKTGVGELAAMEPILDTTQALSFIEADIPNWAWKSWLKPAFPRKFIILSQPFISSEAKAQVSERLNNLSARQKGCFPILIYKDVYEHFINHTCPFLGYLSLAQGRADKLMIAPSREKMHLMSKKALAYFFYNWTNAYIETYQNPASQYRLINKILFLQSALINLTTGEVETKPARIPARFFKTFSDFQFNDYGQQSFDIKLFPDFVKSLRDYFYDDVVRPGILYL